MKGVPSILKLEVLNKIIQRLPRSQDLFFMNMFPSPNYDSDRIRWAMEYGTAGMTPFVAPGSPAPVLTHNSLYSEGSAAAAYWKEKDFVGEQLLNNLREPLTQSTRLTGERQIARKQRVLRNRCERRREWMMAKAFFEGGFTYQREGGTKINVDYGVPAHHKVTLTGDDVWDDGTGAAGATATPIRDIFDAKKEFTDDVGVAPKYAMINSELLTVLMFNTDLQDLLKKSTFGDGDLFARPAQVLGNLLGVGTLSVYDQFMEVGAFLTQDASAGDSTVHVEDATDFEAGKEIRFYDLNTPFDYEKQTIDSVDRAANTITISGTLSSGYSAGKDRVVMRAKFVQDSKFTMFTDTIDGEYVAEFMNSPFGLDRNWGLYADTKEEWDPDGLWMRVQNKGLPVMYYPNATYSLTVK